MSKFTKKAKDIPPKGVLNEASDTTEYPYKKFITDCDTAVFRASKYVQEDYVIITRLKSGAKREFKTKTDFYGHWKNKSGGWLAEQNAKRAVAGKAPLKVEDFEIEPKVRLLPDIGDHIGEGVKNFDMFVGHIKKAKLAPEYLLCIGGKGNYRYDIAETLIYKGNRNEKPLLFAEIRERILDKYKSKVMIVDGKECDDQLAVFGKENEEKFLATGEWDYVLGFIDKDLKMIYSPSINLDRMEEGVTIRTKLECMKHFAKQLLIGDLSVDNIAGLPELVEPLRVKYGVRKGRGLGATTAENYLNSCETIKKVFERVVEAYRAYYGDDLFEYTNYKGETYQCCWIDRLDEVAQLVFMNYYEDPTSYDVRDTLDEYGVKYD